MTLTEAKKEYERIQAIRKDNAKWNYPPVCTAGWKQENWDDWDAGKKPLPCFDTWYAEMELKWHKENETKKENE